MAMTAEEVLHTVLNKNAIPRSPEFKVGAAAFLNYQLHGIKTITPYFIGTASADAFYAGWDAAKAVFKTLITHH